MTHTNYILFDIYLFSEAESCLEILKTGLFLSSVFAQIRICIFIILKLYVGHLKLLKEELVRISGTDESIELPNVYFSYKVQKFMLKIESQLLPFYSFLAMIFLGATNTFNYYSWKWSLRQQVKILSLVPTAFAMFPIGVYKNMVIHGQKKVLDGPGAGTDVIDKGYFDSLKQAHQSNSFEPIARRLSEKPEAFKEGITVTRTFKDSERIIDPLKYENITRRLNDILQIKGEFKITTGNTILGKYTGQHDTAMAKIFKEMPLDKQVQKLEQLYPKTAEVVSENRAAITETEKSLIEQKYNYGDDQTAIIVRAAQNIPDEKKQDTISIFTSKNNQHFIDYIASQNRPLSVMEVKAISDSWGVKQNIFVQDISLISGIKGCRGSITSENLLEAMESLKLQDLREKFDSEFGFKKYLENTVNNNITYNINYVLNMSCSEQYLKILELKINRELKNNYSEFFINNKPLVYIRLSKVAEDDVTYIGANLALDYFSQYTIT